MTTTVKAIYEKGILKLSRDLPLPPHTPVEVTITAPADGEREAWMGVSEDALKKTWENPDDDVFNALRKV